MSVFFFFWQIVFLIVWLYILYVTCERFLFAFCVLVFCIYRFNVIKEKGKKKDLLSLLSLKAYYHALESKTMAPSWNEATIVVIHTEGKDPVECQSYRQLSLMNMDLRILTAEFARRVNQIIPRLFSQVRLDLSLGNIMEIMCAAC